MIKVNIKLTISILLSDRIDTIEKCLESVVPLLQKVPSELILTVTTKNREVLELAKKYTDHIIEYTWINDFSNARNQGLKEAKGQWFMFLDDDEWFDDVTPMINFLESEEEQFYNAASYQVRNYSDWEGKKYEISFAVRMVRNRENLLFEGRVHEQYNCTYAPVKELDVFVHHYGYVNKKRELMNQKVKRNLPLLIQTIQENPNNQKAIVQIIQEYSNIREVEKIEYYCHMGLQLKEEYHSKEHDSWIYSVLTKSVFLSSGVNKAIAVAKEGIEKGNLNEAGVMQLFDMLTRFYMLIKEYHSVLESIRMYLYYYKKFKKNRELCQEQTRGLIVVDEIMRKKEELCILGAKAALLCGEEENVSHYLKELPWNTPHMLYEYYKSIEGIFKELSEEQKELLEKSLTNIESEDEFILLYKMLDAHKKEKKEDVIFYVDKLRESDSIKIQFHIIWLASIYQYEIKEIVACVSLERWKAIIDTLIDVVEVNEYDSFCDTMKQLLGEGDEYYQLLSIRLLEQKLLEEQLREEEFMKQLDNYVNTVISFYNKFYKKEAFEEKKRKFLPAELAFSLYYTQSKEEGQDQIECLKKAKNVYPRMIVVIKRLMEYLLKRCDQEHSAISPEFQQLGQQVKEQVKDMMQKGLYGAAFPVVTQLAQLLPNDLEVLRLKQNILTHLG